MYECSLCMYVILLDATDARQIINIKKQNQNDVQYKAEKPKKLFYLSKVYKQWIYLFKTYSAYGI